MIDPLRHYLEVWLVDFEFRAPEGERPAPVCMVAREWRTDRTIRVWADELARMPAPPFPIGANSLFVAYYSSAEFGCFRALGWPAPARILDLFCEFRNRTNGATTTAGNSLLGALAYFGLPSIDAADKANMRDLAMRPGQHTPDEQAALLDYCETDVVALAKLLPAMLPKIDLPRALLRGRYMAAAAAMEWTGTPIDVATLETLRRNWEAIKGQLVERIDKDYGVYVSAGPSIKADSLLGAAVLDTANDWSVDPRPLFDAARDLWREDREAGADFREALTAVRKATGLTIKRIEAWEEAGKDHATWPELDVRARELASQYPALGIGRGFEAGAGPDDADYAGRLWELLRAGDRPVRPRHDRQILTRAAELITSTGSTCRPPRLSFSQQKFAEYLVREGIPWPRLDSGSLALDDDTFRQMAKAYPAVAPLRELRHALGAMRLFSDLAVGGDGRNRCMLSVFQSMTGRNQPSNAKFIFGPSCWLRSLIQPEPGRGLR